MRSPAAARARPRSGARPRRARRRPSPRRRPGCWRAARSRRSCAARAWRASSAAVAGTSPLPSALDVRRVQPDPLAGQQVVVDGLGQQGVPERVAAARPTAPARCASTAARRRVVEPGGRRGPRRRASRSWGTRRPATDGGAHHEPGGVVELVEAHQQQVGEVARAAPAARVGRGDELLGEERVALGALDDAAHVAARASGRGAGRARGVATSASVSGGELETRRRRAAGAHSATAARRGGAGAGRRCGRTPTTATGASKPRARTGS